MPLTITHAAVATAADDPEAEINKAEWNDDHVVAIDGIEGTPGGTGEGGGDVVIEGGTGDDGNDDGARITVRGGSGEGDPGTIAIRSNGSSGDEGMVLTRTSGTAAEWAEIPPPFTMAGTAGEGGEGGFAEMQSGDDAGGYALLSGGNGAAAKAGGPVNLVGGTGDDGNDDPASIVIGGGSGTGDPGVVTVTSDGVEFTLNQAAHVDPGTGNAADIINALIAAGLMAAA